MTSESLVGDVLPLSIERSWSLDVYMNHPKDSVDEFAAELLGTTVVIMVCNFLKCLRRLLLDLFFRTTRVQLS